MQLCRTVVLGAPSPVLTDKYGILIRALEASMREMKSGAPAAGITLAAAVLAWRIIPSTKDPAGAR